MQSLILFIPNLLKLMYRLLRDPRVAGQDKAILAAVITYVLVPIDIIPDFIPFIGQIDDSYLVAIALLRLFSNTDANIIRGYWDGRGDIYKLLMRIRNLAAVFLPGKVKRALVKQVELPTNVVEFTKTISHKRIA